MLKLFVDYSNKLFVIGFFLSSIMFIPIMIGAIIDFIVIKKLPKILLDNGYNELSEKIKNGNPFERTDPKSKEWRITLLLIFREFRHLIIVKENKRLKLYQNINKIFFIEFFVFSICLLIAMWGIGLSFFGAFITSIIDNESIKVILIMALLSFVIIFMCTIFTKYAFFVIKYY